MYDQRVSFLLFYCRPNTNLLHIVGLEATILTDLLSVHVLAVKSHISTRSQKFPLKSRNPGLQNPKAVQNCNRQLQSVLNYKVFNYKKLSKQP